MLITPLSQYIPAASVAALGTGCLRRQFTFSQLDEQAGPGGTQDRRGG